MIMVSTADLLAISQSSILLPQFRSQVLTQGQNRTPCYKVCTTASTSCTRGFSLTHTSNLSLYRPISIKQQSRNRFSSVLRGCVVPEKVPTAFSVDFVDGTDIEPDSTGGGGGGDVGGGEGNNWGGSGDGSGGDGEGSSDDSEKEPKKMAMSMSQKLTLGYAALVGLGGLMGYLKSGSQKSLLSGGISAALLYYVYTQLPVNPVFASCVGFGLSAALLGVMGTRFKKSGKVFPAGVVSVVSLVMTGGYIHGIMRSFH
ncbi:putative TMEM14 family protein [Helianthus anomalus]